MVNCLSTYFSNNLLTISDSAKISLCFKWKNGNNVTINLILLLS